MIPKPHIATVTKIYRRTHAHHDADSGGEHQNAVGVDRACTVQRHDGMIVRKSQQPLVLPRVKLVRVGFPA